MGRDKLFCQECKDEVNGCDFIECENFGLGNSEGWKKPRTIYCFGMEHYCSMACAKNDGKGIKTKAVKEDKRWEEVEDD